MLSSTLILSIISGLGILAVLIFFVVLMVLRRVVPTNMVHIVQSSKATTSYGKGRDAGNTYYAWPAALPKLGVTVLEFPESNFEIRLKDYEAYDQARLPFMVDVTAFFRIDKSETAAQRVPSFTELDNQLASIVKGAIRRVLATNTLEHILEARSELGSQFTSEVDKQITEWGVRTVKTIEFMDIRDSAHEGSKVIKNIMAKEQSRIDRESRVAIAENTQKAELSEIDAKRTVEVQRQDALQQVGIRTAEKDKLVGIAQEKTRQEVQEQAVITAERNMAVTKVEQERAAEIDATVQVRQATAERDATVLRSEGDLQKTRNAAAGLEAEGAARAKAEEAILLAPVTAQTTLAKEIGDNKSYQEYLLKLASTEAGQNVGIELAKAIGQSDLKIISNGQGGSGDVMSGVAGLADMFTAKGGTNMTGMLAAIGQTPEGQALLKKVTGSN